MYKAYKSMIEFIGLFAVYIFFVSIIQIFSLNIMKNIDF